MPKAPKSQDQIREDEVLRRMLATPPQKHAPLGKKRTLNRDEDAMPESGKPK